MRRIENRLLGRGSAEERSGLLGAVAQTLGVSPTPVPLPDPREPGLYLDFPAKTLDFAVFPHKSRRALAVCARINDKARAWEWLCDQVRTGAHAPEWFHQESVGHIGIIFARIFHKIGGCRLPLSAGPAVAA